MKMMLKWSIMLALLASIVEDVTPIAATAATTTTATSNCRQQTSKRTSTTTTTRQPSTVMNSDCKKASNNNTLAGNKNKTQTVTDNIVALQNSTEKTTSSTTESTTTQKAENNKIYIGDNKNENDTETTSQSSTSIRMNTTTLSSTPPLKSATLSTTIPPWSILNSAMADNVLRFMDASVRPCDNFYQYACGRWYEAHIEQFDYSDTIGLLDHTVNRRLEELLRRNVPTMPMSINLTADIGQEWGIEETTSDLYESGGFFEKMIHYYRACKKVKPYNLKKYLQQISLTVDVDWFVLWRSGGRKWPGEKLNWQHAIARLRQYGLNGVLLKEEVLPRWDDSRTNVIYLDRPSAADMQPLGQGVMIELLMDIGQTKRVANEMAREVDGFEVCLQRLQDVEDEEGAREMQVGYLREYLPEVDWNTYLEHIMGKDHVDQDGIVIIQNIPYMRALVRLLATVDRRIICNYIMLRFLRHLQRHGPAEISRWECVASLRRAMPQASSFLIGRHIYIIGSDEAQQTEKAVRDVFTQLRQQFRRTLISNRLRLPGAVLALLLQKIDAMRVQIGTTAANATVEYYNEYYDGITIDSHNFYANQLKLLRWQVLKHHETLNRTKSAASIIDEKVEENDWQAIWQNDSSTLGKATTENNTMDEREMDPSILLGETTIGSSSSPYYMKPYNVIVIPYGFLQMPIYSRHLWPLFQYSAFGFTLAHEIMHGFDTKGVAYDASGNMMGPTEEIGVNAGFVQAVRCMQNELATCSRSLNEKLADYEGFRLAYATFFRSRSRRHRNQNSQIIFEEIDGDTTEEAREAAGIQRLLPQFTRRQLFFIAYAQFFCNKEQHSVRELAHMEHALDEMRVFETLRNFEEFATEFQCERKDKMKLKSRCRLW